jgi:hypothetical protein
MFLRQTIRKKDGKEHRYFSVVESKGVADGRVVQRLELPAQPPPKITAEPLRQQSLL